MISQLLVFFSVFLFIYFSGTSDKQILQAILQVQKKPGPDQRNNSLSHLNTTSTRPKLYVTSANYSMKVKNLQIKYSANNLTLSTNNTGKPSAQHIMSDVRNVSTSAGHTLNFTKQSHNLASGGEGHLSSSEKSTSQSGVTETGGLHYHDEYQTG